MLDTDRLWFWDWKDEFVAIRDEVKVLLRYRKPEILTCRLKSARAWKTNVNWQILTSIGSRIFTTIREEPNSLKNTDSGTVLISCKFPSGLVGLAEIKVSAESIVLVSSWWECFNAIKSSWRSFWPSECARSRASKSWRFPPSSSHWNGPL